uniref:Putative ovule protein n=1 Tax=Solanum chacoense TaxID=4108 RepID=A0A0V0GWM0_SOLCH
MRSSILTITCYFICSIYLAILLSLFSFLSCFIYTSFEPRVYAKQPLYPTKVGVRSAHILPFPYPTCGIFF